MYGDNQQKEPMKVALVVVLKDGEIYQSKAFWTDSQSGLMPHGFDNNTHIDEVLVEKFLDTCYRHGASKLNEEEGAEEDDNAPNIDTLCWDSEDGSVKVRGFYPTLS